MRLRKFLTSAVAFLALSTFAVVTYGDESECEDAKSSAEFASSDLADSSKALQECAESAESTDYFDDCSMEFIRAKSAHDDYEMAVSDVSSYCD